MTATSGAKTSKQLDIKQFWGQTYEKVQPLVKASVSAIGGLLGTQLAAGLGFSSVMSPVAMAVGAGLAAPAVKKFILNEGDSVKNFSWGAVGGSAIGTAIAVASKQNIKQGAVLGATIGTALAENKAFSGASQSLLNKISNLVPDCMKPSALSENQITPIVSAGLAGIIIPKIASNISAFSAISLGLGTLIATAYGAYCYNEH